MKVILEMDERDVLQVLAKFVSGQMGINVSPEDLSILVKSKQNFKAEWEKADFKLFCEKLTLAGEIE